MDNQLSNSPPKVLNKKYSVNFSNVPEILLSKTAASKHFQKFGTIARLVLRPKRKACTVFYTSLRDVERAKKGANVFNGIKFDVDSKSTEKKVRSRKSEEDLDPTWPIDPEVKAELDAMSNISQEVFLRPKKLEIERRKEPELRSKPKIVERVESKKSSVAKKSINQVDPAQVAELIGIVNQMGSTVEQRYRILEARDKLIRLHTIKQADFTTATQIIGTCPDMCPEKERLMREYQHQVAVYEQVVNLQGDSVMDHSIAIKQYSRSSADQETPLPHELRPVPVLQLTMGYILHKIVDLLETSDVNVSEWYHFVWDRTRGIRKDITQQQLCCLGSVELIEQCSRFHIHCAARLANEDVSVFDQKINTENLTKCLQTLKYMYHDLELKNIYCPNEAEFRGYIILLNLHDGNFMWEVKQLRPEIQKSPEVSFAIKVYSALDNNNYVSFFKLVQSTTYLNACILLRYFNLIRFRALNRIIRTYSSRSIIGQLPLSELQKLLAFEDTMSTISFLEYHGLSLNDFQTHVILNRNNFSTPSIPYGIDRAVNVIESKRTISVGEVICGKALPPKHFEYHIPHKSFDTRGYLKKSEIDEAWLAEIKGHEKPEKIPKAVDIKSGISQPKALEKTKNIDVIDSRPINPFQTASKNDSNVQSNIFGTLPVKDNKTSNIFGTIETKQPGFISNTSLVPFKFEQAGSSSLASSKPGQVMGNLFQKPEQTSNLFQKPEQTSNLFQKPDTTSLFQKPESNTGFSFKPSSNTPKFQFTPHASTTPAAGFKFSLPEPSIQPTLPKLALPPPPPPPPQIDPNAEKLKQEKATLEAKRIELEKQKAVEEERMRILREKQALEKKQALEAQRLLKEKQKLEEEKERQRKLEEQRIKEIQRQAEEAFEAELRAKLLEQRRLAILEKEKRERDVKTVLNDLLTNVETIEKNRKLNEISIKIKNWKMQMFWEKWRVKVKISNKKKKMIDSVPVWMSRRSFHEVAQELYTPNQMLALNNMRRYKTGFLKQPVAPVDAARTKIDILKNIYEKFKQSNEILERKIISTLNWKVVFSLPDENECDYFANKLNNLVLYAFRVAEDSKYLILNQFHPNTFDTFNVSFQKTKGVQKLKREKFGLFFIGMNDDISMKILKRRFHENILESSAQRMNPVVFLFRNCFHCLTKQDIINELQLEYYKDEQKISDFYILIDQVGSDENFLNLLEQGLFWLASNVPPKPPLEMNLLTELYREILGTEFIYRIHMTAKTNESFKLLLSDVNSVIDIYNMGNSYVFQLGFNRFNWEYSDFPEELKQFNVKSTYPCDFTHFPSNWKSDSFQEKLLSYKKAIMLPKFTETWPPKDENELKKILFDYCSSYEKENTQQVFLNVLSFVLDNIRDFNDLEYFPWVHIIQILLNHKINKIDSNQVIIYDKFDFKKLHPSPWWLLIEHHRDLVQRLTYDLETKHANKPPLKRKTKALNSTLDFDLDTKIIELAEANIAKESKRRKTQEKINDLKTLLDDLESSVHIQKINANKIEEIINHEINFNK